MNMHSPITSFEAVQDRQGFVRRNRRALVVVALIVALVAGWLIYKSAGAPDDAAAPQAPRVTVMVPGQTSVAANVTGTGSIAARREMPVGVQGEGGMVREVLVDAGAYVRAGQVLAVIDRSVQTAQLAQARAQAQAAAANARLAEANLARAQQLVAGGFVSKADIDQRTATRDSARAQAAVAAASVREIEARLARLDIRAPAAGLILERNIEPGQIVSSGSPTPVFRMAKDGQLELEARVAEQDMASLRVGMPAKVTPVGQQRALTGEIWLIEPSINPQTRLGTVRVALPRDPALRVGGFAAAQIAGATAVRPVLPQSALLSDAEGSFVYVIDANNKVVRRDVVTGEPGETGISVLSGLTGRERVVQSAGAFLNQGELVKPVLANAK
jgi:RND family efflux transporter MFP subunit